MVFFQVSPSAPGRALPSVPGLGVFPPHGAKIKSKYWENVDKEQQQTEMARLLGLPRPPAATALIATEDSLVCVFGVSLCCQQHCCLGCALHNSTTPSHNPHVPLDLCMSSAPLPWQFLLVPTGAQTGWQTTDLRPNLPRGLSAYSLPAESGFHIFKWLKNSKEEQHFMTHGNRMELESQCPQTQLSETHSCPLVSGLSRLLLVTVTG